MTEAGFAFDPAWFAPHLEFRFPKVGEFNAKGVHVTLRNALEPWTCYGRGGQRAPPPAPPAPPARSRSVSSPRKPCSTTSVE